MERTKKIFLVAIFQIIIDSLMDIRAPHNFVPDMFHISGGCYLALEFPWVFSFLVKRFDKKYHFFVYFISGIAVITALEPFHLFNTITVIGILSGSIACALFIMAWIPTDPGDDERVRGGLTSKIREICERVANVYGPQKSPAPSKSR